MKFSLFVHMERLTPEQGHPELYEEFLRLAEIADVVIDTSGSMARTLAQTDRLWERLAGGSVSR